MTLPPLNPTLGTDACTCGCWRIDHAYGHDLATSARCSRCGRCRGFERAGLHLPPARFEAEVDKDTNS